MLKGRKKTQTHSIKTSLIKNNAKTDLNYENKRKIYEHIYEKICDYLDEEFNKNDYCNFINDKCIANRKNKSKHNIMGCCYSFKYTKTGKICDEKLCELLENKTCKDKCISCKIFTCKYLKSKKINFKITDFPLVKSSFNKKQIHILTSNFFKTKEEIISKLLEEDKTPYILYYIKDRYRI